MGNLKEGKERITIVVKNGYKPELQKLANTTGKPISVLGGEILMRQLDALKAFYTESINSAERVGERDSERVDKRVEFASQRSEK